MNNILVSCFLLNTLLLLNVPVSSQSLKLCSWNIQHLGSSKDSLEVNIIVDIIKTCDVVAIQEVLSNSSGIEALQKIEFKLNHIGHWEFSVSEPTNSRVHSERYAYIWKSDLLTLIGTPHLLNELDSLINREPYFAQFKSGEHIFSMLNYHGLTKKQQPEKEIKYFKFFMDAFEGQNLFFVGDFNIPNTHSVFNTFYQRGYEDALKDQKTTLKQKRLDNGESLASSYDHLFYHTGKNQILESGIIAFHNDFETLKKARTISDHVPIWMLVNFK